MVARGVVTALLLALAGAAQARAGDGREHAENVRAAAERFAIPEAWIWAVMRAESGFEPRAVSRAGAMGLMQLMPPTYAAMARRHGLGADPFAPADNIAAGAAYLREMHDRYGNASAMLAAYNAGPGRYDDYLSRARPLPPETRAYLARLASITGDSGDVEIAVAPLPDPFAWRRAALFVRIATGAPDATDVQGDDHETAPEPQSDRPASSSSGATDPSSREPLDTLFVSRARAGRPQ